MIYTFSFAHLFVQNLFKLRMGIDQNQYKMIYWFDAGVMTVNSATLSTYLSQNTQVAGGTVFQNLAVFA